MVIASEDEPAPPPAGAGEPARGTGAAELARAAAATWEAIDAELSPVIGRRGVAALYRSSLAQAERQHPWLSGATAGSREALDISALQRLLAAQTRATAAAAARGGFAAFDELLATLVGPALTGLLLAPVWSRNPDLSPSREYLS